MTEPEVLAVVPAFLRSTEDVGLLMSCLESLRATAPDVEVLVVDDGSPAPELVETAREASSRLEAGWIVKPENEGFSATVNYGLTRAIAKRQDVVLVNADVEFIDKGWLEVMRGRTAPGGELAQVVGARLLYPTGLIQHGGIFFSLLSRVFEHRFKYAPADLPEALVASEVPVTGALQFIRHDALTKVGVYDTDFKLGYEDVDFCLRVFKEGGSCVYEPAARAFHHESMFRGQGRSTPQIQRWHLQSWKTFIAKWGNENFGEWVPYV